MKYRPVKVERKFLWNTGSVSSCQRKSGILLLTITAVSIKCKILTVALQKSKQSEDAELPKSLKFHFELEVTDRKRLQELPSLEVVD